jgi:hypothetical protein
MRHVASLCRRYAHEIVALPGSRLAAAIVGVGPAVPIGRGTPGVQIFAILEATSRLRPSISN